MISTMAFNTLRNCRSATMADRRLASYTLPKLAHSSSAMNQPPEQIGTIKRIYAVYGPLWSVIGIIGGMVTLAGCIGFHSAKQQLLHSPSVQVSKKRRTCLPEVDLADDVVRSADKFENKSFLRKIAHIQDDKQVRRDPNSPIPYTRSKEVETFRSAGVTN